MVPHLTQSCSLLFYYLYLLQSGFMVFHLHQSGSMVANISKVALWWFTQLIYMVAYLFEGRKNKRNIRGQDRTPKNFFMCIIAFEILASKSTHDLISSHVDDCQL